MRELKFVCCVSDEPRFWWETRVYLNTLKKNGYLDKADILIFTFEGKTLTEEWAKMKQEYPEANFFHYPDVDHITRLTQIFSYIPLFRPYILKKHWEKFPELNQKAIFYTDSDIIFLHPIDFSPVLEDDVCYLSDTHTYLNSDYFDSKGSLYKDGLKKGTPIFVRSDKFEQFKKRDILNETAKICNISREICEKNRFNTGGAQYLLKNIDAAFWEEVMSASMTIRLFLMDVNQQFMQGSSPIERENNGFQSFCADMWAVLWTLWGKNIPTRTPKELDFTWSTDEKSAHTRENILHNAGITSDGKIRTRIKDQNLKNIEVEAPAFYKGAYINKHPMADVHILKEIISHPISSLYHTTTYVGEILDTCKIINQNAKS